MILELVDSRIKKKQLIAIGEREFGDEFVDAMRDYTFDHPHWKMFNIFLGSEHIGFIGHYTLLNKRTRKHFISWFTIIPELRGSCIAQAVVRCMCRQVRRRKEMLVYTDYANMQAIKFYEKIGFVYVSTAEQFCQQTGIEIGTNPTDVVYKISPQFLSL